MNIINARAAILEKKRKINFYNLKLPKPKKNQALIKIYYSGVCGSQFMEYHGNRGIDKWLPHMFGHEAVGKVISKGIGVSKIRSNDLVILSWLKKNTKRNDENGKIKTKKKQINYGPISTFSTFSLIDKSRIYKLPKYISLKHASLYGCSIPTGMGVVLNEARPNKNKTCLVVGVGAVGIFTLIALQGIGVKKIICMDNNPKRLNFLKKLGFKNLINSNSANYEKKLSVITNAGVDYCFECSGQAKMITKCFNYLSRLGRLYFVSHPKSEDLISLSPHDLISGKRIFGSWGGNSKLDTDLLKFHKVISKSKINIDKIYQLVKFKDIKQLFKNKKKINKPKIILKF